MDYNVDCEYADGGVLYDCPSCKTTMVIVPNENYCSHCGKKLKWIREQLYEEGRIRLGLTKDEANFICMETSFIYPKVIAESSKEEFIEILKKLPHKARYTKEVAKKYGTKYYIYKQRIEFVNKLLKKLGVKDFNLENNGVGY